MPAHLRDSPLRPAPATWATAQGYVYPHDVPARVVAQQYPPDALGDRRYYQPTRHGAEAPLRRRGPTASASSWAAAPPHPRPAGSD